MDADSYRDETLLLLERLKKSETGQNQKEFEDRAAYTYEDVQDKMMCVEQRTLIEVFKVQAKTLDDYPVLKRSIMVRTKECLGHFNYVTLDTEGQNKEVVQMSLLSPQGIVDVIWTGRDVEEEFLNILDEYKPVIGTDSDSKKDAFFILNNAVGHKFKNGGVIWHKVYWRESRTQDEVQRWRLGE